MKQCILTFILLAQYILSQSLDSSAVNLESVEMSDPVPVAADSILAEKLVYSEDTAAVEQDPGAAGDTISVNETVAPEASDTVAAEEPEEKAVPDDTQVPPVEEKKTETKSAAPSTPPKKTVVTTPRETPAPKDEADEEADEGFAFHPGLSFGTMTHDGQTWTRFSFRPEISFGKLGVAMDLELFMNEEQQFDSYGWNFDNFDNSMESLARKIYYIRWAHPGDKLYLKGGSLDGITLGYGLIMNGYGNTAQYPDIKLLGLHGQINHLSFWDTNLEMVLNSFRELTQGKGVLGGRISTAPLSTMPLPLLSKLRLGASIVSDIDQFAVLLDRDDDDCPDDIDRDDGNDAVCITSTQEAALLQDGLDNSIINQGQYDNLLALREKNAKSLKDIYKEGDQFSLMSLDAGLPIISMPLISLEVYSELAFQLYQNSDDFFDGGYGLILPGVGAKLGPVSAVLESRIFKLPFFPGHFNSMYEAERSGVNGMQILTKEEKYWSGSSEISKGIYGSADVDLKKVITVGGSYKMMFPESGHNQEGYSARAALGEMITKFIPKVSSGEIFWVKEKVGQDVNPDGDPRSKDGFFDASIYTYAGYALGIQVGANVIVTVRNISTFHRDDNNELERETNLALETAITF